MRDPLLSILLVTVWARPVLAQEPNPDWLVALTFDDASKSHYTIARPVLKKYGFGTTFFVTEGFDFRTNQQHLLPAR
jgi:peptidoglycan/xylan/chitin deacetylase (PgdA/CDA1 family)